jgi:hypothetical protein
MGTNQYESPSEPNLTAVKSLIRSRMAYVTGWLISFLLPAFVVALSLIWPATFALREMPDTGHVLGRISLCIGIRADLVLPVSFLGCAIVAGSSRLQRGWKILIVVGWFPLMLFFELLVIMFVIQLATGYICT